MEIWKDIEGYERLYQVSSLGRVRNSSNYIIKTKMNIDRAIVQLSKNGKRKFHVVANLVANEFIPKDFEWQDYVEHIDNNSANNAIDNLKWSDITNSQAKSIIYARKNQKGLNTYRIDGELAYVTLSNTQNEMVCDADIWEKLKRHTWHEHKGYVKEKYYGKEVFFHRIVKECPKGYEIDHINRNPLDNRRSNLRIVTHKANCANKGKNINNTTGHKGVYKYRKGYIAQITFDGQKHYLGTHKTIQEAIKVRKEAEEKYHNPIIEKETLH